MRRHAKARQVARNEVERPRHRRRAREPQNQNRGEVIHRADARPHHLVRQICQRAPSGGSAFFIFGFGQEDARDETGRYEHHAHDDGGCCQQLAGGVDAPHRIRAGRVGRVVLDQRHNGHTGFKSAQAQSELREDQSRPQQNRCPVALERERAVPAREKVGMPQNFYPPRTTTIRLSSR